MKPEELEDGHIVSVLRTLARGEVEWAKGVPDCYRAHLREAAERLLRYRSYGEAHEAVKEITEKVRACLNDPAPLDDGGCDPEYALRDIEEILEGRGLY